MNTQYFLLFSRWLLLSAVWIFVLLPPEARAQNAEFAPVGAKWWYGGGNLDILGYKIFESVKDTLISNKACKKIEMIYYYYLLPLNTLHEGDVYSFYIHQNGEEIQWCSAPNWEFQTLIDFDAQVGTSWQIAEKNACYENYEPSFATVDSIGTVLINGVERKILYFTCSGTFTLGFGQITASAIEGIGSLYNFLPVETGGTQQCPIFFHSPIDELRCYEYNNTFYHHTSDAACELILGEETSISQDFSYSLNDNTLHITPPPLHNASYYQLFDVLGNIYDNGTIDKQGSDIDIANLTAGMYFIVLKYQNSVSTLKFCKL
ncbi:MAG: T9SS type A sorting domain-containing protein [Sphingobacteriales bacterium]|nr:T9SS type A sorting domain-containing protein [Sphingobacteriales bacterium]